MECLGYEVVGSFAVGLMSKIVLEKDWENHRVLAQGKGIFHSSNKNWFIGQSVKLEIYCSQIGGYSLVA